MNDVVTPVIDHLKERRDLLHRGGQEIQGYPLPGREIILGVDWVLFN